MEAPHPSILQQSSQHLLPMQEHREKAEIWGPQVKSYFSRWLTLTWPNLRHREGGLSSLDKPTDVEGWWMLVSLSSPTRKVMGRRQNHAMSSRPDMQIGSMR